ncbi:MAG: type II secretion system protein [Verrucomicrobia bacterium]|nr:type II secretion system protein [Verrucomicrobiota bacterium]
MVAGTADRTRRDSRIIDGLALISKHQTKRTSSPGRPFENATHSKGRFGVSYAAFTLVELLTVLAIIGILSTLLMSALSTAKKKSRIATSISNLRQIAIAFTIYQDDYAHRPLSWDVLLATGYLGNERVLKCLEDRRGNWGNLVQPDMTGIVATNRHSYLYPLPWDDWAWNRIVKSGPHAGLAACQLHGVGRPDPESPSMLDYEGLVLRAQLDGAVVRREVYWGAGLDASFELSGAAIEEGDLMAPPQVAGSRVPFTPDFPWALFMDEPIERP